MIAAFIIWSVIAVLFLVFGIVAVTSKKQVNFWANARSPEMKDVPRYNRAVAKLWFTFAVIFELLGVPFLYSPQNSPLVIVPILGTFFTVIGIMIAHVFIENKHRKR